MTFMAVALWFFVPHDSLSENLALFYQSDFVSVPEGTLIRAEGDDRVYYAENGHKRWIDSAETFAAQGFQPQDIRTLTAAEVTRYPDGEPITATTRLVLPREQKVLPDLAPLAPYDIRFATVNGRIALRFTGSFWNKGYRAFEILTENQLTNTSTEDVYQHVQSEDGTYRKKFIGTFVWHAAHNHHHYGDFAEYLLEPAQLVPGTKLLSTSIRQKVSFCIRDDERMPADIPNVPLQPVFTVCKNQKQGVSAGWMDVYAYWLSDQYVDVNDFPAGVYALSFLLDPMQRLIEEHGDNNIATTIIEFDPRRRTLRVIAAISPFQTLRNRIVDGTLLRDAESGKVYVIEQNRKHWLQNLEIFNSYGYSWGSVYPVTKAMIEAIPSRKLIRRKNTEEVFILNEQGYARHVLNPTVFYSYGFTPADIADVNYLDFTAHPDGNLIMRPGDIDVYSIDGTTKRSIGKFSELQAEGFDLRGLHLVNQVDFDAYSVVTE